MTRRRLHIINDDVRLRAMEAVADAPEGVWLTIQDDLDRTAEQNRMLHAIFGDFEKAGFTWAGRKLNARQIKHVLVIAHAVSTLGDEVECVSGLEAGEPVLIHERESTAAMGVRRLSSLLEYCIAYAAQNNIPLSE